MDDLVTWIRQQIDDDEEVAGRRRSWMREGISCVVDATDNRLIVYGEGTPTPEQVDHIVRWDPSRVLAEMDAKRRILDLHQPYQQKQVMARGEIWACSECGDVDDNPTKWPCETVRLLALPYAGRPGYRNEWPK